MHGANRLGGNSLSDLLVFGKRAGECGAAEFRSGAGRRPRSTRTRWRPRSASPGAVRAGGGENPYAIHEDLRTMMQERVGIVRSGDDLKRPSCELDELEDRAGGWLGRAATPVQPGLAPGHRPAGDDDLREARRREPSTGPRAEVATPARTYPKPIRGMGHDQLRPTGSDRPRPTASAAPLDPPTSTSAPSRCRSCPTSFGPCWRRRPDGHRGPVAPIGDETAPSRRWRRRAIEVVGPLPRRSPCGVARRRRRRRVRRIPIASPGRHGRPRRHPSRPGHRRTGSGLPVELQGGQMRLVLGRGQRQAPL